ncbi:hypothetical protein F5Y08DRAFT_70487 [Xylaria arbuscula]|nr:hypothetical protein F5Y08DRAFT_70487 [Xylaria arbuscula]
MDQPDNLQISRNTQDYKVTFCDDGGRPRINEYPMTPRYRPNDEVYIRVAGSTTREGPYLVGAVLSGKYTLCEANGRPVQNGKQFEERDIELKDPFE